MGLLKLNQFSSQPDLKKKIEFRTKERERVATQIPSDFYQFLVSNGIRRNLAGTMNNAGQTTTIYTCPSGKDFYIVGLTLSGGSHGIGAGDVAECFARVAGDNVIRLVIAQATAVAISLPLTFPLKIVAGETIIGQSEIFVDATITCQGYELDIKQEKQSY